MAREFICFNPQFHASDSGKEGNKRMPVVNYTGPVLKVLCTIPSNFTTGKDFPVRKGKCPFPSCPQENIKGQDNTINQQLQHFQSRTSGDSI